MNHSNRQRRGFTIRPNHLIAALAVGVFIGLMLAVLMFPLLLLAIADPIL